jgi:DNA-binding transcriptional ArsR family regulator
MLQISQRPLSGSDADQRLFVDREEETSAVLRALELGFSVLVVGDPKSGRTSLLRHVERLVADSGRRTAFVDGLSHEGLPTLLEALRGALGVAPGQPPVTAGPGSTVNESDVATLAPAPDDSTPDDSTPDDSTPDDSSPDDSAPDDAATVFVDNLSPGVAQALFGRFRDALWQLPYQWVVAGLLVRRSEYLEPPADSFFDSIVELGSLDEKDARSLLRTRIETAGDSEDAHLLERSMERIVKGTVERTPGALLAGARATLLRGAPDSAFADLVKLQTQANSMGRGHAMVFSELESLAPVHAGDERLLQRLGYTRPRIVQILKDLESEGVVESRREGRRQMYYIKSGSGLTP